MEDMGQFLATHWRQDSNFTSDKTVNVCKIINQLVQMKLYVHISHFYNCVYACISFCYNLWIWELLCSISSCTWNSFNFLIVFYIIAICRSGEALLTVSKSWALRSYVSGLPSSSTSLEIMRRRFCMTRPFWIRYLSTFISFGVPLKPITRTLLSVWVMHWSTTAHTIAGFRSAYWGGLYFWKNTTKTGRR